MTILVNILTGFLVLALCALGAAMIYALSGPSVDADFHMTYEEEMDWLMNEMGMSEEAAKEIAEIPHRRLDK